MGRQSDEDFRGWAVASRPALRRTAFLLSGDWFLADDLVQETLVRMYGAWPRIDRRDGVTHYSRRVLVNLHLDHRRRPSRRERPTDDVPDRPCVQDGPADDDREAVLAALRCVPPRQRAVLVLRFWDDLSVDQTAEVLGIGAGTVKSQTSRGLVALRSALAAQGVPVAPTLEETS